MLSEGEISYFGDELLFEVFPIVHFAFMEVVEEEEEAGDDVAFHL